MKNINLKIATFALTFAAISPVGAQDAVDVTPRLRLRDRTIELDKVTKKYLFDLAFKQRVRNWSNHWKNLEYVRACQKQLGVIFPNKRMLSAMCYVLRQDDRARRADYLPLVQRWSQEIRTALFELKEDPRYYAASVPNGKYNALAAELIKPFEENHDTEIETCFAPVIAASYRDNQKDFPQFKTLGDCLRKLPAVRSGYRVAEQSGDKVRTKVVPTQADGNVGAPFLVPYFSLVLPNEFPGHPGHAVSETGWIPGNQVTYLTRSDTSADLKAHLERAHKTIIDKYAEKDAKGEATGNVNRNAHVNTFVSLLQKGGRAFGKADGLWDFEDHPAWNAPDGYILNELKKAYARAEDTIFMDLFFLGGSTGGALANHLFDLLEKKPNLKIFILHDSMNPFAKHIDAEMTAVFNYIQAYSVLHPDRLVAVQAHIRSHKSGLPKFSWGVLTDDLLKKTGLDKSLSLYGRAMSDHSKVTVIDGKTDHPVSFVGSKNMTDASGPNCYDEVVRTEGPAATVVQDDYYRDMVAAVGTENSNGTTKRWAVNGWTKGVTKDLSEAELIAAVIKPFDPLERNAKGEPTVDVPPIPVRGTARLRTGFNSYDSARTNLVDENVQMILFAQKRLFMKDQYLFDRNLVRAMLQVKKARPNIDMRVILEPLPAAGTPHMPNILYLDVLKDAGIPVKWKKTLFTKTSPVEQVYHMKTISADGKYVIAGSANKDQTTMFGSFREEQNDVFDPAAAAEHDRVFESHWNDPEQTEEVTFDLAHPLQKLEPGLTFRQFLATVRAALAMAFDARDL